MTKKQYETLKQYEKHLSTAVKCDYARNLTVAGLKEMEEVYREIFHRDGGLESGCSRCRLRGLKDLGRVYYEYKDKQACSELEPEEKAVENQVVKKPKPKVVTNKKETTNKRKTVE